MYRMVANVHRLHAVCRFDTMMITQLIRNQRPLCFDFSTWIAYPPHIFGLASRSDEHIDSIHWQSFSQASGSSCQSYLKIQLQRWLLESEADVEDYRIQSLTIFQQNNECEYCTSVNEILHIVHNTNTLPNCKRQPNQWAQTILFLCFAIWHNKSHNLLE